MTRLRLLLLLVIGSVTGSLALLLPGCFKNPRELVLGEWQEVNKLGYVEVTDSTARWRGGNYKATFHYTWTQDADEPYTVEVSRNGKNGRLISPSNPTTRPMSISMCLINYPPKHRTSSARKTRPGTARKPSCACAFAGFCPKNKQKPPSFAVSS